MTREIGTWTKCPGGLELEAKMKLGRVSIDNEHCPACPAVNDEGHKEEAWSVGVWLI